jgi:hypothetical protein
MTPVDMIAVIFAIGILFNFILVLVTKPDSLMKLMEKFYPKKALMSAVLMILIAVMGYYLLAELTIAQIFVAAIFGMYIYGLMLAQYPKELVTVSGEIVKNKQKAWLAWSIFIILALWVLYSVFG